MVIEYIGDLIRNEVANKREIVYEAQVLTQIYLTLITFRSLIFVASHI